MLTRCPSSATNHSHSLSLRELEEKSGVSYNTIWRIEDGRQGAHPRTVRKLAEALGVEPKELIRETS
jgi:transcriptional regulator with XRE-family HTH domain